MAARCPFPCPGWVPGFGSMCTQYAVLRSRYSWCCWPLSASSQRPLSEHLHSWSWDRAIHHIRGTMHANTSMPDASGYTDEPAGEEIDAQVQVLGPIALVCSPRVNPQFPRPSSPPSACSSLPFGGLLSRPPATPPPGLIVTRHSVIWQCCHSATIVLAVNMPVQCPLVLALPT